MISQEIFINCILAILSIWIIKNFLDNMFEKKEKMKFREGALWITLLVFQFLKENGKGEASILVLSINICLVTFLCIYIYKVGMRKSLLYVTLLYAMWMLAEFVVFLFFNFIPLDKNQELILGSIVSKIIIYVLLIFLKISLQHKLKHIASIKYWGLLFLVPVSSIWISYNILLLEENSGQTSAFTIISFLLILFINLIIFEFCDKLSENIELQKESAVFEQQLELIEKYSAEHEDENMRIKIIQHDLNKHLNYLRGEAENNNNGTVVKYIDTLLDDGLLPRDFISSSGNLAIDSLINFRCSNAEKLGINVRTNILIPSTFSEKIRGKDICIILGNAIDNAIEAAKLCEEKKFIDIAIVYKKKVISIVIQNSYLGNIRRDSKGNLLTNKKSPANHGLGLSSIRRAIERYSGEMLIEEKNQIFRLSILLLLET